MNRNTWKRLAALRGSRRRQNVLPPPETTPDREPLPPLAPPDDDREFLPWPPPGLWPVLEPVSTV